MKNCVAPKDLPADALESGLPGMYELRPYRWGGCKSMISLSRGALLSAWLALLSSCAVDAAGEQVMGNSQRPLMDFTDADQTRWIAVNDGVMGGISEGRTEFADGLMRFTGDLSLANNGGFSSVRTRDRSFDLSQADALRLRVKGDGRRYELRLATDARFRRSPVSYRAQFGTAAGEWMEVSIPLASLQPSYRGFALRGPPLDPSRVEEIGLLIADGREGRFDLLLDWIAAE